VSKPAPHRPVPLLVAAVLASCQALVLAGWAVLELLDLTPGRATMAVTTSIFFLGYAAALAFCVWGLLHLDAWARSPIVLTQLIELGLAWNLRDAPLVALALVLVALAVLVGVFHPASVAAVESRETGEGAEDERG
jgi:hypothetical protein